MKNKAVKHSEVPGLLTTIIIAKHLFTDTDDCIGNPCGTNECINKIGSYECVCKNGYSGSLCQNPPDFCQQNSCQNAAGCVTGTTNYTCICPYGFHGAFCENKAGKFDNKADEIDQYQVNLITNLTGLKP